MNLPLMIVKKLLAFSFGMLVLALSASAQDMEKLKTVLWQAISDPGIAAELLAAPNHLRQRDERRLRTEAFKLGQGEVQAR